MATHIKFKVPFAVNRNTFFVLTEALKAKMFRLGAVPVFDSHDYFNMNGDGTLRPMKDTVVEVISDTPLTDDEVALVTEVVTELIKHSSVGLPSWGCIFLKFFYGQVKAIKIC